MKKSTKSLFFAAAIMMSNTGFAKGIMPLAQASEYFDKPYLEFGKMWMQETTVTKTFDILGAIVGMDTFTSDKSDGIRRSFVYGTPAQGESARKTFEAYCLHKTGEVTSLKDENFCVKDNKAIGYLTWVIKDTQTEDIHFLLLDAKRADKRFNYLTSIKEGDTIETKYGEGMVIERKGSTMLHLQPTRTNLPTRWITTQDTTDWLY